MQDSNTHDRFKKISSPLKKYSLSMECQEDRLLVSKSLRVAGHPNWTCQNHRTLGRVVSDLQSLQFRPNRSGNYAVGSQACILVTWQ